MSWFYTIIFSGLMFSNGAAPATEAGRSVSSGSVAPAVVSTTGDETERFEQNYPLTANGRVSVSNVNGSINIQAWDKNEVRLESVKTADSKESLDSVQIRVDSKADWFSVETDYGDWKTNGKSWNRNRRIEVQLTLMVPRGAVLNEIETVNGSVTVSNFTNSTRISAVNGNVNATNLRGAANLSTVNGDVIAQFDQLDNAAKLSLSTVNGRVNLTIPSDSNATVKADSVNGNIANDFGLPVRKGKYVGRDLYGRIGSGTTAIRLESVNGELKIVHSNDGRTVSPSVNLLPEKDKEDWDDDEDKDDDKDSEEKATARADARVSRDAARDAARVARTTARINADVAANIDAQVRAGVMAIGPVIAKIDADKLKISAEAMKIDAARLATTASAELKALQPALAALADARNFTPAPRVERKSNLFTVTGTPSVTVNAPGCSVRIVGTDSPTVRYSVTDVANSRNSDKINVIENHTSNSVDLTVQGADDGQRWPTRIEVFVPKKANLTVKTDQEIRIDGVTGTLNVEGDDESINLRDVGGKLTVASNEGRIRLVGFKGELDASSSCGMLSLEGDFSAANVNSQAGEVIVTMPADTSADIETQAENVTFDGFQPKQSGPEERRHYKLEKGGKPFTVNTGSSVLFRTSQSVTTEM